MPTHRQPLSVLVLYSLRAACRRSCKIKGRPGAVLVVADAARVHVLCLDPSQALCRPYRPLAGPSRIQAAADNSVLRALVVLSVRVTAARATPEAGALAVLAVGIAAARAAAEAGALAIV